MRRRCSCWRRPPIGRSPREGGALRWAMILTGLLLGAATLCTQKAIVPAAALIFAQLAVSCCRGRLRRAIRARRGHAVAYVVFTTAAIVATWLAATGLFFLAGGAGAFLDATLMQLWRWPVRLSPWESLRPTLSADLTFWIVAAAAVVAGMSRLAGISRRMEKPDNRDGRQNVCPAVTKTRARKKANRRTAERFFRWPCWSALPAG